MLFIAQEGERDAPTKEGSKLDARWYSGKSLAILA
jgi:hypothetical protein